MTKTKRRLKKPFRILLRAIIICLVFVVAFKAIDGGYSQAMRHGWNLILVNRDHPLPRNYQLELLKLDNGQEVDVRIYPDLQAMFDDARYAGLELFVRDGYRSHEEQVAIMNEYIDAYLDEGNDYVTAKHKAEDYVALPGTSEHELGLSVDINADNAYVEDDEVYDWLDANAYKYGFIKRYANDKIDITGINNEPWHYRYVGYEHALYMQEHNLCLEEYIEYLDSK